MEDDVTTKRIIHGVFGGIIVLCISVIALLLIYGKQANYQIYLQAKAIIDASLNVVNAVAPSSYEQDIDYLNSVIGGRVDLSDKSITGEVRRIITSNSDNQEIQDLGLQAAKVLAEAKKQLAQTKLAEVQ